jgi:dephospho-CoA kinase
MIRVGITGGIGSGKSIIARVLSELGHPVFNSDMEAKRLMQSDPEVISRILGHFGNEAYQEGAIDRKYIAERVFNDPELLSKLNAIVHPAVRLEFERFVSRNSNSSIVFNEAAILFETGAYKNFNFNILVTAPLELRVSRVVKRDNVSREQVLERINNQWSDDQKKHLSDFVLLNDEREPVLAQLLGIIDRLQ